MSPASYRAAPPRVGIPHTTSSGRGGPGFTPGGPRATAVSTPPRPRHQREPASRARRARRAAPPHRPRPVPDPQGPGARRPRCCRVPARGRARGARSHRADRARRPALWAGWLSSAPAYGGNLVRPRVSGAAGSEGFGHGRPATDHAHARDTGSAAAARWRRSVGGGDQAGRPAGGRVSAGDGTVQLRSRSGEVITSAYPELRDVGGALGGTPAVLDGEIVALDEQGRADFERLQSRMGLTRAPVRAVERAAELTPAHLVLFDVMFLGGQSLLAQPYAERRQVLRSLGPDGPRWSVPGAAVGRSAEALDLTRASGLEGIVCKRLASRYEPGCAPGRGSRSGTCSPPTRSSEGGCRGGAV